MNEKSLSELSAEFKKWRKINTWIDRVLLSILLFLTVFIGSGLIDGLVFLEEGINAVEYHSFEQLKGINPDTVAWLTLDNTHINNPVVRSADNFDYLDKGFDGKFYAGGTLFMDMGNSDLTDEYCIIHGHHMAAGAMFGDLEKYLDPGFFEKNSTGTLLTPEYDYDIKIFAAGVFDAYDRNIYAAGGSIPVEYIKGHAENQRDADTGHVLALSTCLDDMTNDRIVVFCSLVNKRTHK